MCFCVTVPPPETDATDDVWAALESNGWMARMVLDVERGPSGSFGISLNDGNVVTNVGADSVLERLDVILEVNGEQVRCEQNGGRVTHRTAARPSRRHRTWLLGRHTAPRPTSAWKRARLGPGLTGGRMTHTRRRSFPLHRRVHRWRQTCESSACVRRCGSHSGRRMLEMRAASTHTGRQGCHPQPAGGCMARGCVVGGGGHHVKLVAGWGLGSLVGGEAGRGRSLPAHRQPTGQEGPTGGRRARLRWRFKWCLPSDTCRAHIH